MPPLQPALAVFADLLHGGHYDTGTLRALDAALVAGGDASSLLAARSSARDLLRRSSAGVLSKVASSRGSVMDRLVVAEFFARAFALAGDIESCLVIKYETLVLRQSKCSRDWDMQVSANEWLNFAKNSIDNRFYNVASKAYEFALMCEKPDDLLEMESGASCETLYDIRRLHYLAKSLTALESVQTKSAKHLNRKAERTARNSCFQPEELRLHGSSSFRLGIQKRNHLKLVQSRGLNPETS